VKHKGYTRIDDCDGARVDVGFSKVFNSSSWRMPSSRKARQGASRRRR
jgi:hypothetical protein